MPLGAGTGLLQPQNTFIDKISKRFRGTQSNFVLGNAEAPPSYPIVYCSDGFCELVDLPRADIMQEPAACSFIWGPATDAVHKKEILAALDSGTEAKLQACFYRAQGTEPFWCLLDIIPIMNELGKVVLFLLSTKDISNTYTPSRHNSMYSMDSEWGVAREDEQLQALHVGRRRSRAVLTELEGRFLQAPQGNASLGGKVGYCDYLQSRALPLYQSSTTEGTCCIIPHYGSFRKVWDCIILAAIMYVALIVPYNAAFNRIDPGSCDSTTLKSSIACDILVEMIFILDIIFNFRMTFVNGKGEVVYKMRDIALNYVKGWFLLDLIAALPFDLLYATCSVQNMDSFTSVDILKLTRLVRVARFLQKMDRLSQYSAVILSLLMTCFILLAHWLACLWYVIGWQDLHHSGQGWLAQLAHQLNTSSPVPQLDAYITSLYFTTSSLTTVGFGNVAGTTRNERGFSVFCMFLGALMHATIFGNVASIVGRMYARRAEYDKKVLDLEHFAKVHKLPREVKQRMADHVQTKWFFNRGLDSKMLAEYPQDLQGEISYHLYRELLDLPLFESLPHSCRQYLGTGIETQFAGPNEFLVHQQDLLAGLWYISSGSLEVVDGDDLVVAILGRGDLIGSDLGLHMNNPNQHITVRSRYNVKALTYCELKAIDMKTLVEVVRRFPGVGEELAQAVSTDLTCNLRCTSSFLVQSPTTYHCVAEAGVQTLQRGTAAAPSPLRRKSSASLSSLPVRGSLHSLKDSLDLPDTPPPLWTASRLGPCRSHSLTGREEGASRRATDRRIIFSSKASSATSASSPLSRIQRFQARFARAASLDVPDLPGETARFIIPEIKLDIPEEDSARHGAREATGCREGRDGVPV